MDRSERAAITALQQGDIGGLEALVQRHQVRALRTAYAITGDRMAAEDVVGDAFLAAYERIAQFDPSLPFAAWFFRIVANRAVDLIRKARPITTGAAAESFLAELAHPAPGPEEEALRHERQDLVVRAIRELPTAQRAVLVQRYYLDWEEAAIARASGSPLGTVKSRLSAAKKKLRVSLAELGLGVPAGRTEEQRLVRGALATHVEETVPDDSSVWPTVRRRLPLVLRTIPHPQGIATSPLASGEQPPSPPDFSGPIPVTDLLVGPPRSGTPTTLEEAEDLAGFPILVFGDPTWELTASEYCPAEAQRATAFDPPRYAWRMPAVTLRYQAPGVTATVVEHRNVYPVQVPRFVQAEDAPLGKTLLKVEQLADADYLVRYRRDNGLVQAVQFATVTSLVFVEFAPATAWSTAGAFVRGLQPTERSMAMELSRRAFLGTAGGLAVVSVSGCSLPGLPPPTGKGVAVPATRVGGVRPGGASYAANTQLTDVLPQAVAAVAASKTSVDPRIIWLTPPVATPAPAGQQPTASVVDALAQTLSSADPALRPELLALGSSVVEQSPGAYVSIGPDAILRQLAGRRLIRPLDDLVRSTAAVTLDDYFPGALDAVRVDGTLYALPLSVMPTMLLYDRELLDAAGVTAPAGGWDWQQLLAAGRKLTNPPSQYALAPGSLNVGLFVEQNGGAILSPDGTRCLLDQPAAVEAAAFYAGLFQPRTIVAPAGPGNLSLDHGMLSVGGVRIALLPNWADASIPVEQGAPRRLHLAEPFHGKAPSSSLGLQDAVVMTTATSNPASSFPVLAALAGQLQQRLFVPATLSRARVVDPRQQGLLLDGEEKAAILRTARDATYAPPGPDIIAPLRALDAALQGGQDPLRACQAATTAIDAVLSGQT